LSKNKNDNQIISEYAKEKENEKTYFCKDCEQEIKSGGRCFLNREGALTPCNSVE
jgi:hypothetical protein